MTQSDQSWGFKKSCFVLRGYSQHQMLEWLPIFVSKFKAHLRVCHPQDRQYLNSTSSKDCALICDSLIDLLTNCLTSTVRVMEKISSIFGTILLVAELGVFLHPYFCFWSFPFKEYLDARDFCRICDSPLAIVHAISSSICLCYPLEKRRFISRSFFYTFRRSWTLAQDEVPIAGNTSNLGHSKSSEAVHLQYIDDFHCESWPLCGATLH